jgi:hypothetical protein
MKTYYCDLGWRGGVVVVAENEQVALKLVKEQGYHKDYVSILTELNPHEVYTFYGDS